MVRTRINLISKATPDNQPRVNRLLLQDTLNNPATRNRLATPDSNQVQAIRRCNNPAATPINHLLATPISKGRKGLTIQWVSSHKHLPATLIYHPPDINSRAQVVAQINLHNHRRHHSILRKTRRMPRA